jgi:hypothetical protein
MSSSISNARPVRGPLVVVVMAISIIVFAMCACRSRTQPAAEGMILQANLPLASYIQTRRGLGKEAGSSAQFFFPELHIYGEGGALIYSSHESFQNAKVLTALPNNISKLRPTPGAANVVDIIDAIPAFRARRDQLMKLHRPIVLSIFLQDCHACSDQEDALGTAKHQLLDEGIDLLVIDVSRQ